VIRPPYLLFLGDAPATVEVKTATGIAHWRPGSCVGQYRLADACVDLGLPDMDPARAKAAGAGSMVLGVANEGGFLDARWMPAIRAAITAGLDVVSGLHERLNGNSQLVTLAESCGVALQDVRVPPPYIPVATGVRRSGKRLLTVGTDCVVGKMFTALALEREMKARGMDADFRATGQTGILIVGSGVPVDAVPADFIAGAVEQLTPANAPDHWDVIEGQGALHHPLYAGVTLGLVHGAQADALVLCHAALRETIDGLPDYPIPDLEEAIERYEQAATLTNRQARVVGLSVNTSSLDESGAHRHLAALEQRLQMPAVDAVRTGVARLVDALEGT
jgi:uncharacterized NAD-dependent epimerase/dehydratase family protein